ncbi:hypothetical protein [Maridesulfovibrio sp.]|uniref:hypothetical protein n=1 Tax=Maridesulfovibrio sp. TaxID=2795000 RepID=UPI0039F13769
MVESSTELAGEAGQAIGGIVDMINSTTEMVQAIAAASEEHIPHVKKGLAQSQANPFNRSNCYIFIFWISKKIRRTISPV